MPSVAPHLLVAAPVAGGAAVGVTYRQEHDSLDWGYKHIAFKLRENTSASSACGESWLATCVHTRMVPDRHSCTTPQACRKCIKLGAMTVDEAVRCLKHWCLCGAGADRNSHMNPQVFPYRPAAIPSDHELDRTFLELVDGGAVWM